MSYVGKERAVSVDEENRLRVKEVLSKIKQERGLAVEVRVAEVFWDFIGSSNCPPWLTGYLPTWGTPADEDEGIDGYFFTDMGEIEIQIKTSPYGVTQAKKNHPEVPVFCVESTHFSDKEILAVFLPRLRKIRNRRHNRARPQTQPSALSLLRS